MLIQLAHDDKQLRRAGLDYREFTDVREHARLEDCIKQLPDSRLFAVSTKGQSNYADIHYKQDDAFLFGPETRGLPAKLLNSFAPQDVLRIPMQRNSRSLNLANAASILVYEAWRQLGFEST